MSEDTEQYLQLLERRIELLQSLSGALQEANSAVASCDITRFEECIAKQESLCGETGQLNAQIAILQDRNDAAVSLRSTKENQEWNGKLRDVLARSRAAAESVKYTNGSNQAVVRRSKRTVTALLNALQTFEGNYANPAVLHSMKPSDSGGQA